MKKTTLKKTVLVLMAIFLTLGVTGPFPKTAIAASAYIKNIAVTSPTCYRIDVGFDLSTPEEYSSTREAYITYELHDELDKIVDTRMEVIAVNGRPGGYHSTSFYLTVEPDTEYTVVIKFNYLFKYGSTSMDSTKISDPVQITTAALADPQIGLTLKTFSAEEAVLQGIMINSGTGYVDNFDSDEAFNALFKTFMASEIAVVKKSDYRAGEEITTTNVFYSGKIVDYVNYPRWNVSSTGKNVFLCPQTLSLKDNTEYVAQVKLIKKDYTYVVSPTVSFKTYKKPAITITDNILHYSDAYVFANVSLDSRDTLIGLDALIAPGISPPAEDPDRIMGTLVSYSPTDGKALFYFNGLEPDTQYSAIIATNSRAGKYYSNSIILNTLPEPTLATASTGSAEFIKADRAKLNGTITDNGNTGIIEQGFLYATSDTNLIMDHIDGVNVIKLVAPITSATLPTPFAAYPNDLNSGTLYYYRAYVRNSEGLSYGDARHFSTLGLPAVTTTGSNNVTENAATFLGSVGSTGGLAPTLRGFVYSESNTNPEWGGSDVAVALATDVSASTGSFTSDVSTLSSDTTYYYRAFIHNSSGTYYGTSMSLYTDCVSGVLPIVTTKNASGISEMTAIAGGTAITQDTPITDKGVVWSTFPNPTIGDQGVTKVSTESASPFNITLNGLSADTTYYYRAFATNSHGTTYGGSVSFKTTKPLGFAAKAYIASSSVVNVGTHTADFRMNVTTSGTPLFTRLVIYSSTASFPLKDMSGVTAINAGTFAVSSVGETITELSNLLPDTTYYVRGYTSNASGEVYGNVITFTTGSVGRPVVTNGNPAYSAVTKTAATVNFAIQANGSTIEQYGVVYSAENEHPFLNEPTSVVQDRSCDCIADITGHQMISGLTPNTQYWVVAFAEDAAGIEYGETISFTTLAGTLPILATMDVSPASKTALTGVDLQWMGDYDMVELGVVIGNSSHPMVNDVATFSFLTDFSNAGEYPVQIQGLAPGTTYYVRAYAKLLGAPVQYGNDVEFTTNAGEVPTVISQSVSGVSASSVSIVADVRASGDSVLVERGILYGSHSDLELTDSDATVIAATLAELGEYSTLISGLTIDTLYYARAYATNQYGTAYGEALPFLISTGTSPTTPPVSGYTYVIELRLNENGAIVNGETVELSTPPLLDTATSRTLVPLRFVSEVLGAEVNWLSATKQVQIIYEGTEILLTINSTTVLVNGVAQEIDCPAQLMKFTDTAGVPYYVTYVPLRFVSETLGAEVIWDPITKGITIKK